MFERHSGAIGRTLRRQGLSPEAAEDATQQAFLIASERLDEIRPDRERAFLFGVVLRVTSSKRRRLARYQFEADMDVHPAPGSALDEANERVLALELFNQVLERLDQDLMQAFVLFELQDLSKNEVARELGIPAGTAASRRRRARQTVEATLARLGQLEVSPARLHRTPLSPQARCAATAAKAKGPIAKLPVAKLPVAQLPDTQAPDTSSREAPLPEAQLPGAGRVLAESALSKLPVATQPVASASYGLRTERRMRLA
jgi:RNA polymerase sigma-70 factor (ECF subfamily)